MSCATKISIESLHDDHLEFLVTSRSGQDSFDQSFANLILYGSTRVGGGDEELILNINVMICFINHLNIRVHN